MSGQDFHGKCYWIVGASEGLGRALARELDKRGARLLLSARGRARLEELAAQLGDARALPLDVTDAEAVRRAAAMAGECDGVIYAAGAYDPVSARDWKAQAVARMGEVNFVGALHVLGQLLPRFLRRDSGHVVLIGSLSGHRGLPGAVGYGASKAALMHLAENLFIDLRGTGVRVQVINPGFIATRLTDKNDFHMPQLMQPEEAAERVVEAMESGRFQTDFPRPFAWVFTWGRHLPFRLFARIFARRDDG